MITRISRTLPRHYGRVLGVLSLAATLAQTNQSIGSGSPPNVVVIITDDQGYGEVSAHGNPILSTPSLDRIWGESIRLADFHVAPMCTPTRGQLLTGVDAVRNGATNVSSGRTLLRRGFPTIADVFGKSGYATGLFGKWHLGDNYPYRPQDRGFTETLWFPSSHINSLPDTWDNDYFDDTYIRNGTKETYRGYTTDIFFREAIEWMGERAEAGQPFFCFLPTAAPHWPHFVPDHYREPVADALEKAAAKDPKIAALPKGRKEALVSFLAMIANIDENIGKLDRFLDENGLKEDTLLIFLTDNGSTMGEIYFNAGMRGKKTTLWEGGHRVPCFFRWPGGELRPPGDLSGLTQVQDLFPTLVDLCLPSGGAADLKFDGTSLAGVLKSPGDTIDPDRMLVINYSRMPRQNRDDPAVQNQATITKGGAGVLWKRWRLLENKALYNLDTDPLQKTNVIRDHPEVVAKMRSHLDGWWDGVKEVANQIEPVVIGSAHESPSLLTACEWENVFVDQQRQTRRLDRKNGTWNLEVASPGRYRFELRRWPEDSGLKLSEGIPETVVTDGTFVAGKAVPIAGAKLEIDETTLSQPSYADAFAMAFESPPVSGKIRVKATFLDKDGNELVGAYYLRVEKL